MQQPDDIPRIAGQLLGFALTFGGAIKCLLIAKRPTTNKKCVWGLAAVLGGWCSVGLIGIIARTMPANMSPVVLVPFCLAALALAITGIILATLGLIEMGNQRGVWVQGKSQAIWSYVLAVLFALPFSVGFYRAVSGLGRVPLASQTKIKPGTKIRFPDANFQFEPPDERWVQIDKNKVNPIASLVMMRGNPGIYFIVIAEKLGVETDVDNPRLVEVIKANLKSVANSSKVISEKPGKVNGYDSVEIQSEFKLNGHSLYSVDAVFCNNGYAYQLLVRGNVRDRATVQSEATKLMKNFSILDPKRVAHIEALKVSDQFTSIFGYEVNLQRDGWRKWAKIGENMPDAEYGVLYRDTGILGVIPIFLGDHDPDWDGVVSAALARVDVSVTDENLVREDGREDGAVREAHYSYERSVDGQDFVYRFRVRQNGKFVYVCVAWHLKDSPEAEQFLTNAISQVTFVPEPKTPHPGTFTPRDARRHALVLNDIGIYYYKAHLYEKSIPYFQSATTFDPKNKVHLKNLIQACIETKQFAKGLESITKAEALGKESEFQAMRAYLLSQTSEEAEAVKTYDALFRSGYRSDEYFTEYLNLLFERGEIETALSRTEKYLESKDSVRVRIWQASLYRQQKEFDKAIRLLETQQSRFPSNTEITFALWESYHAAGRDEEALLLCEQLLKKGFDSGYSYSLRGRAEFALKRYREAKTSFELALKKEPTNSDYKTYLDHISGMLGEGDNSSIKTPIVPVSIPEHVANKTNSFPDAILQEFGAFYEYSAFAISFEKGKELKTTEKAKVKIVNRNGVSKFSSVEFGFDPLSEEIFVNELVVRDQTGKVVSTGKPSDYYVVDQGGEMATQNKTLHAPISGLQPGYTIEWTATKRDFSKANEFRFQNRTLSKYFPVARSVVYLTGDTHLVKQFASPGVSAQKVDGGVFWAMEQPPTFRFEPLQQVAEKYLPMVWLSDASITWPRVATDYLETIKGRLEIDSATRTAAEKHVSAIRQAPQKIVALADFVQTNVTYKAIEFGRRAMVPNPAAKTLENRYGDCKDHAVLLHQMLKSIGIQSHLALIHSYSVVREDMPSLDQFDHVVVYVPTYGSGTFFDCTIKNCGSPESAVANLSGQKALVLDPDNPRLVTVPDYPKNTAKVTVQRILEITNVTDVLSTETITLSGFDAFYNRAIFRASEPANWKAMLQQQLAGELRQVDIQSLRIENLDAVREPLTVQLTTRVRNSFQDTGESLLGRFPVLWELSYVSAAPSENRQSPFQIRIPRTIESKTTVRLPSGFKLRDSGKLNKTTTSTFGHCATSVEEANETIIVKCDIRQDSGSYSASEYSAFEEAMQSATAVIQPNFIFDKAKK